jgi:predicted GIY-YIG superfamily endonuclease
MVNIYTLKLEHGKFYVGKTNNPVSRINGHVSNYGSAWTRMHKPLQLIEIIPNCDDYDEDKYTLKYMKKYGVDNVRGGSFCEPELDDDILNTIDRMLTGSSDKCFRCGRKGHFVNNCYAQTHANGTCLDESESESESDNEILSCYRCGRDGHFANRCYAKRDIYGRPLF